MLLLLNHNSLRQIASIERVVRSKRFPTTYEVGGRERGGQMKQQGEFGIFLFFLEILLM